MTWPAISAWPESWALLSPASSLSVNEAALRALVSIAQVRHDIHHIVYGACCIIRNRVYRCSPRHQPQSAPVLASLSTTFETLGINE